eukprot:gene25690-27934_t
MKKQILLYATALTSIALMASPAFAQATVTPDSTQPSTTLPSDTSDTSADGDSGKEILVTGSRIRGPYKGADPVVTIRREDAVAN